MKKETTSFLDLLVFDGLILNTFSTKFLGLRMFFMQRSKYTKIIPQN